MSYIEKFFRFINNSVPTKGVKRDQRLLHSRGVSPRWTRETGFVLEHRETQKWDEKQRNTVKLYTVLQTKIRINRQIVNRGRVLHSRYYLLKEKVTIWRSKPMCHSRFICDSLFTYKDVFLNRRTLSQKYLQCFYHQNLLRKQSLYLKIRLTTLKLTQRV